MEVLPGETFEVTLDGILSWILAGDFQIVYKDPGENLEDNLGGILGKSIKVKGYLKYRGITERF